MDDCVFAIDFSCDAMTASFVMADGTEVGTAGFDLGDFHAGDTEPLDKLAALLAAKSKAAPAKPLGVMLAIAADLDKARTKVLNYPGASWLNDRPLADIIRKTLDLPVMMERRAVVLLAYDMAMLNLPADALVIGCYVDTHYQSAIWHCGAPLLGRNGMAGDIAHMAIHDREDSCFCGKSGCVDLYGTGTRLRQMHTMIFPDMPLEELFLRNGDHPIIRDYLSMMAYPIAIECNIVDPDFLVLGGDIPSMRGFPRKFVEEQIARHRYCPAEDSCLACLPSAACGLGGLVPAAQYARMRDLGAMV